MALLVQEEDLTNMEVLHYKVNFSSFNAISVHSREMNVTYGLHEVDSSGSRLKRLAAWTDQRSFQNAGPFSHKQGHNIGQSQ